MTQSSDSGFFWPWPLDVNEYSSMQFILILNSYYLYYKWYWVEPRPENSEPMEGAFTAVIWVPGVCVFILSVCSRHQLRLVITSQANNRLINARCNVVRNQGPRCHPDIALIVKLRTRNRFSENLNSQPISLFKVPRVLTLFFLVSHLSQKFFNGFLESSLSLLSCKT